MWLSHLFTTLLHMSLTASIAILVVCVLRLLLKRAPKVFSYALWLIVLFRLLCPISIETAASILPTSFPHTFARIQAVATNLFSEETTPGGDLPSGGPAGRDGAPKGSPDGDRAVRDDTATDRLHTGRFRCRRQRRKKRPPRHDCRASLAGRRGGHGPVLSGLPGAAPKAAGGGRPAPGPPLSGRSHPHRLCLGGHSSQNLPALYPVRGGAGPDPPPRAGPHPPRRPPVQADRCFRPVSALV